jgi:phosphoserine aminotransferase
VNAGAAPQGRPGAEGEGGMAATTETAKGRAINFSAGPAALPEEVLHRAQRDLLDISGSGIGVLEHSHRGKVFDAVMEETEALCRQLAGIPDGYKILFLQGGASTQFFQVPMSFLSKGDTADYLVTGSWSQKAAKEAQRYGGVHEVCNGQDTNFSAIPARDTWSFTDGAAYCHFTSNNTIFGTEFFDEPAHPTGAPLVCDASSDIFSKPIDVARYGLIYAGAQKNLGPAGCALVIVAPEMLERASGDVPTMMSYKTHAEKGSRYNTPNTFAIYLMGEVFKWIRANGGLEGMGRRNREKADYLYAALDESPMFRATVAGPERSRMNVCFRCEDESLEPGFIAEAEAAGMKNLKGHRSVGGMRASIYNALGMQDVRTLVEFMRDFESRHG